MNPNRSSSVQYAALEGESQDHLQGIHSATHEDISPLSRSHDFQAEPSSPHTREGGYERRTSEETAVNGYTPLHDVPMDYDSTHRPQPTPVVTQGHTYQDHSPSSRMDRKSLYSIKEYNHRKSRKFLLWTGFNRLCVTLTLCILISITLKGFEGYKSPRVLSIPKVRSFNAILLGLSLALGLNLSSSLRHYGLILRWAILTRRFVSLRVFDLILGCENLINVFKLMVVSIPGIEKLPLLGVTPRKDGSKYTWAVCLIWLLINVGTQVLVASLSIFWPVNSSQAMPLLTQGDVSVSNLQAWEFGDRTSSSRHRWEQLSSANAYGITGSQYTAFNDTDDQQKLYVATGNAIFKGNGYYEYTFLNRNPDSLHTDFIRSSRTVQSRATCSQFNFGRTNGDAVNSSIVASLDGGVTMKPYRVRLRIGGCITWTGMLNSTCGPRCANVLVYQTRNDDTIPQNSMFWCNSTVSEISGDKNEFSGLSKSQSAQIYSSDEFAQVAAGAIAWTGYNEDLKYGQQGKTYLPGLPFAPDSVVTVGEVEDILSRFSIGAIAALDDHGPRINITNQKNRPTQGQQLEVDWLRILIILTWIISIQSGALIALLACANKSIIRDESFFSMAMLLAPVVNKINLEHGANLSGEEIYEHPNLEGRNIRYDYVKINTETEKLKKVDVLFEDEQGPDFGFKSKKRWGDGSYI